MNSMKETALIREGEEARDEEIDTEKIRREFVELPSEKVELLANHLMRPDGFAKTLITGSIATSAELQKEIGQEFVKTHRGHYMSYPPSGGGENDYLSFNVGKAQRLYQESSSQKLLRGWQRGLGFTVPAEKLMYQENVLPSYGGFYIKNLAKNLRDAKASEPAFEKFYNLASDEMQELDFRPPKKDFLTLVNMARKAGTLTGGDQAEINMRKEKDGKLPRLSLKNIIILIPAQSDMAFKRYLDKKIKDIQPFSKKLFEAFGVDISKLTADIVLAKYKNIYFYPQKNIELAINYLTTHPERLKQLLEK